MKAIGNGRLDGERLSRSPVQNHRVLLSVGTEDPGLAVPGWATQKTAAASRQILFRTVAAEVDRFDRRLCREIKQLLFCVDVHLGHEGAELRHHNRGEAPPLVRRKTFRFGDTCPTISLYRAPIPTKSRDWALRETTKSPTDQDREHT